MASQEVTRVWYAKVNEDLEIEITSTANVTPGYKGDFSGPIDNACAPEGTEVTDIKHTIAGATVEEDKILDNFLYALFAE